MKRLLFGFLLILGVLVMVLFNESGVSRIYIHCDDGRSPCLVGVNDGGYSGFIYQGRWLPDYYRRPVLKTVEFAEIAYRWPTPNYLVLYINGAVSRREIVDIGGRRITVDVKWIAGDPCETAFKPDAGYGPGLHCAKGEGLWLFE